MHLIHPGPANPLLLTETFSIPGLLTPSKPVSYKSTDSAKESNGFGTLAAAGWSHQDPIFDARCEAGGELAIARAGEESAPLAASTGRTGRAPHRPLRSRRVAGEPDGAGRGASRRSSRLERTWHNSTGAVTGS